jgi:ketosteroid isomerase-like protein
MSRENVEWVRSSIEAYNTANRDAYLEFFTEDVEVCPDASRFPEARPFRGREEFGRFVADIDEGWEGGGTAVIREVFPVGDRVVARADWGGKGRTSGIDLQSSVTAIYTFRNGRIVKIEFFFDHAEALEAAGLSEQDVHADS